MPRNPKKRTRPHGTGTPDPTEPQPGKCGARLRKSNPPRYCRRPPLKGRTRCKLHGGATPRGPESPHFKDGTRSLLYQDMLGGLLRQGYLALANDEGLVSVQEQIRLWTAREHLLVKRISDGLGESASAWRQAQEAMKRVEAGMRTPADEAETKAVSEVRSALGELQAILLRGAAAEAAWSELEACSNTLRKLKEAERRKRDSEHAKLSVDHVLHLAGVLTQLALHCITEAERRQYFMETVRRIARGEDVRQIAPGVALPEVPGAA